MYLKSIDELPAPFPLPAFITFHSLSIPSVAFQYLPSPFLTFHRLSIPFIAFHYLPSPFNTSIPSVAFHYLSSPPHLIVRPLSAPPFCPRLSPLSHHAPLSSPRPVLSSPCPVSSSPRPTLSPCPRIPPLHTCFPPASSPPLFHTSVFHAPLSAPLCFTPSIVLHPVVFYFLPLCFALSRCFASFVLLPPPLLYSLPLFCTRFFTPRQPPQTRPRHRKRQRFSHFSKKFCKKPLTKQKKVLY